MLVFTRKKGERIVIDGKILVELVEIRGDRARIGVTASKIVSIDREEIHLEKLRERLATGSG